MALLSSSHAERLPGLEKPVEILRDRWGVPHIYASTSHDLFFAQGYIAAKDRLFQLDLWRRAGSGRLAEVQGPSAIPRDRIARAVAYRGDWSAEWASYAPDAKAIVLAFTQGINAYIDSLKGKRPAEFQAAGYDPGKWKPEDCVTRVAGMVMVHNLREEIDRAIQIRRIGLAKVQRFLPPDPNIPIELPHGLDLNDITSDILQDFSHIHESLGFSDNSGSNNWVVDGKLGANGRPLLANDPHRAILLPSLRKTVHLVGPGWDAIGSGEPGLPGIAIGHNDRIAFGLTIAPYDQADLYVEKVNPANAGEYRYRGEWKKFAVEHQEIAVKGAAAVKIDVKSTLHGPVIYENPGKHLAYVLRWVGTEPGTAGYLGSLSLARAHNWSEFLTAASRFKVPCENLVYADTGGNIGWIAAGLVPIRPNWAGLLPVPGDTGEYEWSGFRKIAEHPQEANPARHYIATANQNNLPPGYPLPMSYKWTEPFRFQRIREMLEAGKKFDVADFERMQQDVVSIPARRLQAIMRKNKPSVSGREARLLDEFLAWDCRVTPDSRPALVYNLWLSYLLPSRFSQEITPFAGAGLILTSLEEHPDAQMFGKTLAMVTKVLSDVLGPEEGNWRWGRVHQLRLRHPLGRPDWNLPVAIRGGDKWTVNASAGLNFHDSEGPSWREIIDVGAWDRSVMTNVPGEVGDPGSRHYRDLLEEWAGGRYHPMPYSRKAVEAAAEERMELTP